MHIISEDMASVTLALFGFLPVNLAALCVVDRTLGTGCSGIDVLVPSLLMLCASLCAKYRLTQLEWEQLWSCDIEVGKQRWLRDVMKVPTIFADMCKMPSGKAFCFAQQCIRSANAVFAFSRGFSCQSVSSANTHTPFHLPRLLGKQHRHNRQDFPGLHATHCFALTNSCLVRRRQWAK